MKRTLIALTIILLVIGMSGISYAIISGNETTQTVIVGTNVSTEITTSTDNLPGTTLTQTNTLLIQPAVTVTTTTTTSVVTVSGQTSTTTITETITNSTTCTISAGGNNC